ncbi:Sir2 family NAD-dependent protein deacetylase [Rhodococcus sp. WAY2]|nr:Sir2 family NAD-dependent protein deacetylase [Rhodococcus sp. WAY2]
MLGPDIVYFGENAPEDCAAASFELVDATDTLLMAGSSLMLMAGPRFAPVQPKWQT